MTVRAPAVWISRPPQRARSLATQLQQRGLHPILRPALVIRDLPSHPSLPPLPSQPSQPSPLPSQPSTPNSLVVRFALPEDIHLAVFITAEAADREPPRPGGVPVPALVVGAAVDLPTGFVLAAPPARDSAELLALPLLQNPREKNIAVLGGVSAATPLPSPPLCAELVRRGARVFPVAKYFRQPAPSDDGALAQLAADNILRAAVAFSAESLQAMLASADPRNQWLRQLPLFVHHPAVARFAERNGFSVIIAKERMADAVAATLLS